MENTKKNSKQSTGGAPFSREYVQKQTSYLAVLEIMHDTEDNRKTGKENKDHRNLQQKF